MSKQPALVIAALLLTLPGCASNDQEITGFGGTSQITFPQLKAAPESFKGQPVVFGGEVLAAKRMKDGTRIEILQLPLDGSGIPGFDLTQSQGRFVAMHREFLDPATIPRGTRLTVSGDAAGTVTLPLDETEYTYPVIEARRLQIWPHYSGAHYAPRPYYGPYPYGPYGGPYWRPWPYR
jgi:outer membrane lipoprotein